LSPLIKLLPRAETAVVNAYLAPMIETYLARIRETLSGGRLHVMTSAGGLVPAEACRAKDGLLSGPAGGVAGAAAAAARSGFERVIGFDMGGTSTDVARYDGDYEYQFEHRVGGSGGVRLVAPALAIETVAAGGGSVCTFADEALRVGPESASAVPGPASYGAGGPLTLTDVNLLLGRLDPERFEIPISLEPAEAMLDRVCDAVARQRGERPAPEGLLEGFLDIANERMGDAIAEVSLRRGYDPRDYDAGRRLAAQRLGTGSSRRRAVCRTAGAGPARRRASRAGRPNRDPGQAGRSRGGGRGRTPARGHRAQADGQPTSPGPGIIDRRRLGRRHRLRVRRPVPRHVRPCAAG
ncbi:MAG: hydantoinase/oxoprolinase family protein, partial [Planctomycetota bacterium]